ncbi:hypothetical protein [Novosphingobium percolationis]|uniref:hypothetical protein n=1 Tax=Novosphingobium percolationis TaxID=2871811 RepID=UPI001CD4CF51|nr:hypothetical protein [Novosphingobium percolationis]
MIEIDDNARRAIDNARALLDAMLAGGWNEVCVTGEEGDYFLARQPGTVNPLLVVEAALPGPAPALVAVGSAQFETLTVKAPHVGTVVWLAPVGQAVAEGEVVARLAVLDETLDVPAAKAGKVAAQVARIDDLAEFATPLIELAA